MSKDDGEYILVSKFRCPRCKKDFPLYQCIEGCCLECSDEGYWMDPAGTLQQGENASWSEYE